MGYIVGKKNINAVVTIDIYSQKFYRFESGSFELVRKLKANKKDRYISYIANSDLIIEPMDISSHIPDDEIENVIIDKVYDELRLDTAVEYGVYPVKIGGDGSLDKYQTIIIDKSSIKEKFQSFVKKIKYIDYVIPAPLLYKSLYSLGKLKDKQNDMFIYFGDVDTFITFYKRGEFIYSKSIDFSLKDMYARACQLAQEVFITEDEFRNSLRNGAYKEGEGRLKELLTQILNECFLSINDILVYAKRVYGLDKISKAYVGFSWGYVDGIESYVKNYLSLDSAPISSIYTSADPSKLINPIHALMIFTEKELEAGILDLPNLTPFPRPKPFMKRPAGIMITLGAITAVGISSIVIYDYVMGFTTQLNNSMLKKEKIKYTTEANKYKALINQKQQKLKAMQKMESKLKKLYNDKKSKLKEVYNKKFKYKLKSEQLLEITKVLENYDILSKDITVTDTMYMIDLESTDDKQITAFVKDLVKRFNFSINDINLDDIKFDNKDRLYKGVVKIEFSKDY